MAEVQRMQKKTSTMSLTISSSSSASSSWERSVCSSSSSSSLTQKHSSLVQPLCISPQRTQSPLYNQQYLGNGVTPTFVKCLHDVSAVKGQLVVLECRLRGTPPLQVMWYREDEQILDSDDFRILRKKASSASVPEELCTLVITEAFPEDSGLFKCVVINSFGTVSCSAMLEVYNDLEEQLNVEAIHQQEAGCHRQEEAKLHEGTSSPRSEDIPPVLPDCVNLPPPEWPESPLEDNIPVAELPEPQPANHSSVETLGRSEEESALSSEDQVSEVTVRVCTPSNPPPPSPPPTQAQEEAPAPRLFTPSKLSFTTSQSGGNMNLPDLPTLTPSTFPPSAFNYERPRHFIQSQPAFQAPSYESVLRETQENQNHQQSLNSHSVVDAQSQVTNTQTQSVSRLPKPILKKSVAPRPSSSRSTEEDIQGSKDALIQDLEKKLRSKEARRRHGQKLSYEERMARRLLGPDNATYMFDQDNLSDSQLDQPDSPEGRHTGGLWGRHHSGTDGRSSEGSAIQEKCFAPRFLQIPPDLTVEEGRFCRIDFKVSGLPAPDISWFLDGKAIRPDDYHKMLVCEKGMHSFIIEIVTVHHAGVYECVARNRGGESRFTMRLEVLAQEALRPPTFIQKMLNTRALEGDTVRLECKVDASPPPQLFWKKDKDMLRIDPNRMSLYQDGSGRQCLLIERLMKSDAGWYTLSAINEAGMSTCNARLDVGTPAMKTAPPASKTLKLLSSLSHVPALTEESPAQHTAPLYESEEL
uniref:Myotilin n=1 Tax=Nothobranchius furzeri TaxID=105023 RepID=A0A8C6M410_NOTFU